MSRYIILVLLSFVALSFSAHAEKEKIVTRLTGAFLDYDSHKAIGYVSLSIFNVETNPILTEFHSKINGVEYSIANIKEIKPVPVQPGSDFRDFEIILDNNNLPPLIGDFRPKSFRFSLPTKIVSSRIRFSVDRKIVQATLQSESLSRSTFEEVYVLPNYKTVPMQQDKPAVVRENDKRITRVISEFVNPVSGKKGTITISILDAETKPVLIEFIYSIGEGRNIKSITSRRLEGFELVAENPRHFKIRFKDQMFFDNDRRLKGYYKDFFGNLPTSLDFDLNENNFYVNFETSRIIDQYVTGIKLPKSIKRIALNDFKAVSPISMDLVFDSSIRDPFDHRGYFNAKGLQIPSTSLRSGLNTPTAENDKRITRVTSKFTNYSNELGGFIKISILDAETKPALIEFVYTMGDGINQKVLSLNNLESFKVLSLENGEFQIQFNEAMLLHPSTGKIHRYLHDFEDYLPESLTFNLHQKVNNDLHIQPTKLLKIGSQRIVGKKLST